MWSTLHCWAPCPTCCHRRFSRRAATLQRLLEWLASAKVQVAISSTLLASVLLLESCRSLPLQRVRTLELQQMSKSLAVIRSLHPSFNAPSFPVNLFQRSWRNCANVCCHVLLLLCRILTTSRGAVLPCCVDWRCSLSSTMLRNDAITSPFTSHWLAVCHHFTMANCMYIFANRNCDHWRPVIRNWATQCSAVPGLRNRRRAPTSSTTRLFTRRAT